MTTTDPLATEPAVTDRGPTWDSRRFRTRFSGGSLMAAAVLILAGVLSTPPGSTDGGVEAIQNYVDHPGLTQISASLLHFGYLLVLPGLVGLMALTQRRAARLGLAGTGLAFLGFVSLAGNVVLDLVNLGAAQQLGAQQASDAFDRAGTLPAAAAFIVPAFLGSFAGLILLMVALGRSGELAWVWVAVTVIGIVLMFVAPVHLVTIAGFAGLGAGLCAAGARLWREP